MKERNFNILMSVVCLLVIGGCAYSFDVATTQPLVYRTMSGKVDRVELDQYRTLTGEAAQKWADTPGNTHDTFWIDETIVEDPE